MLLSLEEQHRMRWKEVAPEIPYGLCQCGCGTKTRIAPVNSRGRGLARGMPVRFVFPHQNRNQTDGRDLGGLEAYRRRWDEDASDIPYGMCQCGCGKITPIASRSDARKGQVKGEPKRFAPRHHGRKRFRYTVEDRGHNTPCWIWQLSTTPFGYPMSSQAQGTCIEHRRRYIEKYGPLADDQQLDHLCRVRACINPDHLEPVTNAENSRRGANAKLTWPKVEQIRLQHAHGSFTCRRLANIHGVCVSTIQNIVAHRSWKADILSKGAAKAIGMYEKGVAPVEVKRVTSPTPSSEGPEIVELPKTGAGW